MVFPNTISAQDALRSSLMYVRRPNRVTGNDSVHLESWHQRAFLKERWSRSTIPFEEGWVEDSPKCDTQLVMKLFCRHITDRNSFRPSGIAINACQQVVYEEKNAIGLGPFVVEQFNAAPTAVLKASTSIVNRVVGQG
ncbi:hypothetical protein NPIL_66511 [Nephila pilipes]|uniref:Uncharacterized protein n=1 Tax=Nephila pilipes TaxID=299642 RepID=A0A8X6UA07_NEPPI|nr:hypothetical protein NPIL_66511 [Nephila pilipes]